VPYSDFIERALDFLTRALYSVKRALQPYILCVFQGISFRRITAQILPYCAKLYQKSPGFYQKSPITCRKSPAFWVYCNVNHFWFSTASRPDVTYSIKRALDSIERDLHSVKREYYQGTLYLYIHTSIYSM